VQITEESPVKLRGGGTALGSLGRGDERQMQWKWRVPNTGFDPYLAGYHDVNPSNIPKGGLSMPTGQERTKEKLYSQAKRLGIKGRSKMNKGQLKAALARRGK
jgi:hypothetical protein